MTAGAAAVALATAWGGGGSEMEASVASIACWMAADGLAGCCGNVMVLAAVGAAVVAGRGSPFFFLFLME